MKIVICNNCMGYHYAANRKYCRKQSLWKRKRKRISRLVIP